jgi:hypothetical protein
MRYPTYTSRREVTHIDAHMLVDIGNTHTRVLLARTHTCTRNRAYYAHTRTTTHSCKHASHWSALSSCGQVLQQCAALPHRLCYSPQGCTHMRVRRAELTMRYPIYTHRQNKLCLVRQSWSFDNRWDPQLHHAPRSRYACGRMLPRADSPLLQAISNNFEGDLLK